MPEYTIKFHGWSDEFTWIFVDGMTTNSTQKKNAIRKMKSILKKMGEIP